MAGRLGLGFHNRAIVPTANGKVLSPVGVSEFHWGVESTKSAELEDT